MFRFIAVAVVLTGVAFADLPAYCERAVAGGICGRGVVQFY
jgi:hypothetical protein